MPSFKGSETADQPVHGVSARPWYRQKVLTIEGVTITGVPGTGAFNLYILTLLHCTACGILVSQPGIESRSLAVRAES